MSERSNGRRGNYSMLMGFSVIGLLGFGALGVDISYIAMANAQAQAVSDAASHAALLTARNSSSPFVATRETQGKAAAQWVADNNRVGLDGPGELDSITFGVFNSGSGNYTPGSSPSNAAQARVTRDGSDGISLLLAPIIGINKADISQEGITVGNPREVVVVIDRSCSMDWGWPQTGKAGTDDALTAFAQYMTTHQVPLDRMGATAFNSNGSWFDPLRYVAGNEAAIMTKWSSWDSQTMSGNTNQAAGMSLAINALIGSGNPLAFKALIVISDGNPNPSGLSANFKAESTRAWANGIHVWTVAFGDSINDSLMGLPPAGTVRGIGAYHKAPNSSGLSALMIQIAESFPVALVD